MKTLLRILRGGVFAIGLLLSGLGAGAIAGLSPFTGPAGTNPINFPAGLSDFVTFYNQLTSYMAFNNANSSIGPQVNPTGRVFAAVGPILDLATNTGVTIETYTIPANSFDAFGRTLRIHANFHKAANFHAGAAGCGVAANIVSMQIATTSGAGQGTCDFVVTEGVTANTQMYAGTVLFSTTSATTAQVAQLQGTTSSSITTSNPASAYFQVSDPTAAADIVLDNFEVYYEN